MKSPLTWLLLLSAICACSVRSETGQAKTFWLPIVATRSNLSDALSSLTAHQSYKAELRLVKTDDCRNLRKGLYIVVAGNHDSRGAAESAVTEWRERGVEDAYLRRCEVVVPSRLSLSVPLLDQSFMQRSVEAVNWDLEDAVGRVIALNHRFVALIIPRYEEDPEDIREGLRIGVRLYNLDENRSIGLSPDCIDPEFVLGVSQLAMTCVNETAATYLLHRTLLYALPDGGIVADESRCTTPEFKNDQWVCQKESVDAEGVLKLEPKMLGSN